MQVNAATVAVTLLCGGCWGLWLEGGTPSPLLPRPPSRAPLTHLQGGIYDKPWCLYYGRYYPEGGTMNKEDDPCNQCTCESGRMVCRVIHRDQCPATLCVDAVTDTANYCCPFCPNGSTCRAFDGTVVQRGTVYSPDPDTECRCGDGPYAALHAVCDQVNGD